jgi:predicted transcriptional regulator
MNQHTQSKPEVWEGDFAEFLGLSAPEAMMIEILVALSQKLREARRSAGISQVALAERLGTRQPNIARLENGAGRSVTIDALTRALLELEVSVKDIAAVLASVENRQDTSQPAVVMAA